MKRVLVALLILAGSLTTFAAQQEAIDIKGDWTMTIETQQGAMPVALKFTKVEGEDITGAMSSPAGELALAGTLKGAEIKFAGTIDMGGRSLTLTFAGKIEKGVITGQVDFGGMGGGAFSAKRAG